jgi:hypothetical protein
LSWKASTTEGLSFDFCQQLPTGCGLSVLQNLGPEFKTSFQARRPDRGGIFFDCRMKIDAAMMSSTIPAHVYLAHV